MNLAQRIQWGALATLLYVVFPAVAVMCWLDGTKPLAGKLLVTLIVICGIAILTPLLVDLRREMRRVHDLERWSH